MLTAETGDMSEAEKSFVRWLARRAGSKDRVTLEHRGKGTGQLFPQLLFAIYSAAQSTQSGHELHLVADDQSRSAWS